MVVDLHEELSIFFEHMWNVFPDNQSTGCCSNTYEEVVSASKYLAHIPSRAESLSWNSFSNQNLFILQKQVKNWLSLLH